jgi:hypothetical protein
VPDFAAWHAQRKASYMEQFQQRATTSGGSRTLRGAILDLVSGRPRKDP